MATHERKAYVPNGWLHEQRKKGIAENKHQNPVLYQYLFYGVDVMDLGEKRFPQTIGNYQTIKKPILQESPQLFLLSAQEIH